MREPVQVYFTSKQVLRFSPLRSSQNEWLLSQERQRSTRARWQNPKKSENQTKKTLRALGQSLGEAIQRASHPTALSYQVWSTASSGLVFHLLFSPRSPPGGTDKACSWRVQCEEVFFEASGAKKGSRFPEVNYFPCEHLIRNFILKPHLLRGCPLF